jgi:GT2 family glycosyltransferase
LKKLDIVIVNWNSGEQLKSCLESIAKTDKNGFELNKVVVVDNTSSDNSLLGLEEIDLPLKIIKNSVNRGFAAACNQGAKESDADYLLFLNPDTLLFEDSLSKPIAFMGKVENRNIGIVGIQLVNENKEISRTCAQFPTLGQFVSKIFGLDRLFPRLSHFMIEWDHKNDRIVDQVMGAFFLVRRELFEKLNGFDERFFVYFEEVDFSYRAKQLGYSSYYLASAQAYHKGGGSSEKVRDVRLFYSLRSRILYGYKHFNWISATFLAFCTLIIEPITRIVFAVMKGAFVDVIETLKAYKLLWSDIPRLALKGSKVT